MVSIFADFNAGRGFAGLGVLRAESWGVAMQYLSRMLAWSHDGTRLISPYILRPWREYSSFTFWSTKTGNGHTKFRSDRYFHGF